MRARKRNGTTWLPQNGKFLRVQECPTRTTSAFSCVPPIAQPFLNINNEVVKRQDISHTCVPVLEPRVGKMRVKKIINPRNLFPCPFGLQGILQVPQPGAVSQRRRLCLQLRCVSKVLF